MAKSTKKTIKKEINTKAKPIAKQYGSVYYPNPFIDAQMLKNLEANVDICLQEVNQVFDELETTSEQRAEIDQAFDKLYNENKEVVREGDLNYEAIAIEGDAFSEILDAALKAAKRGKGPCPSDLEKMRELLELNNYMVLKCESLIDQMNVENFIEKFEANPYQPILF